jgi:hypothetical protein
MRTGDGIEHFSIFQNCTPSPAHGESHSSGLFLYPHKAPFTPCLDTNHECVTIFATNVCTCQDPVALASRRLVALLPLACPEQTGADSRLYT